MTLVSMCGIFGYIGKGNNAAAIVLDGLKMLEYRGYDSWGVAVVPITAAQSAKRKVQRNDSFIFVKKKAGKIGDASVEELPPSSFGFGHTRWATHGGVTDTNAHPHLDCDKTIAVIHNGIIENYDLIREKLRRNGHHFISQTDTEVASHLIEEYSQKLPFIEAVRRAFNDFEGLNAFIALNTSDFTFVALRNGSPLVIGFGKGENFLASDASALLPHTRLVHFLEDGEMAVVSADVASLSTYSNGKKKQFVKRHLTWSVAQAQKGAYPHFMLKEIHEQPEIILRVSGKRDLDRYARVIKRAYGTYMVGCGTAYYACLAGQYLFSKIAKQHLNACAGSEFSYQLEFLTKRSLVWALSQSGETMDTLEAVKNAKKMGATILALVNVLGSTLYREADYSMLIDAGPEKAVASTKAFIGKLCHIILLAYTLAAKPKRGRQILISAAKAAKDILSDQSLKQIKLVAEKIKATDHIYVVGRGLSYIASLETALKIKEISYIHAEGFAAGELKHGVIALIEKGTPCIVFAPNDETYGANLAGAMELKARGGYIIGISYKPHEVFDEYIAVSDVGEATVILNVIVGQMLAYYLATGRSFDPDMPRNLAKSVTVK